MAADVYLMEPMLPNEDIKELEDLAFDLIRKGSALASRLDPAVAQSIGDLVRSMNCYYSNLIEGHDTHPISIEKAMAQDFSSDPKQRNLQQEAVAHIEVQTMIDENAAPPLAPYGEYIKWVHKEFCVRLPKELLQVKNEHTGKVISVVPGQFREDDVQVGRHIPPRPEDLDRFMGRFEQAYDLGRLSKVKQVIAIGASHHRLAWIHPFLDGNGRVARLFSHAFLRELEIGSTLWSVSRGLARNVETYKERLMAADSPRKGDLDGRGNLSHRELVNFCQFFLESCIDQIDFMSELLDLDTLRIRMEIHIKEEIQFGQLHKASWPLLQQALLRGQYKRGDAQEITNYGERQARDVLAELLKQGYLVSDGPKSPVRLGFPPKARERWLPKLYPA
tara:strand:+ start:470 stop:1642 length:1173 start_codon:yes stop_codon:yes gene_type:complete